MPKTKRGRKKTKIVSEKSKRSKKKAKRGSIKIPKLQTKNNRKNTRKAKPRGSKKSSLNLKTRGVGQINQNNNQSVENYYAELDFIGCDITEFIKLLAHKKDEKIRTFMNFRNYISKDRTPEKKNADKAVKYYKNYSKWSELKGGTINEFKKHFMKYVFSNIIKDHRIDLEYVRDRYIKKLKDIFKDFNKKTFSQREQKQYESPLFYNIFKKNVLDNIFKKNEQGINVPPATREPIGEFIDKDLLKYKLDTADSLYGYNLYNDVDYFYDNYLNVEEPDKDDKTLQDVLNKMSIDDKGSQIFSQSDHSNRQKLVFDNMSEAEQIVFLNPNFHQLTNPNQFDFEISENTR